MNLSENEVYLVVFIASFIGIACGFLAQVEGSVLRETENHRSAVPIKFAKMLLIHGDS
jgi:hypothetical protein